MAKRMAELISSGVILGFSLFMFWASGKLEYGATYPRIILVVTFLFALLVLMDTFSIMLHKKSKILLEKTGENKEQLASEEQVPLKKLALLIIALLVYFALWPIIGYVLSSLFFMIGLFIYYKYPVIKGIVISAAVTLTINVVFKTVLQVPLPAPEWLSWL